MNIEEQMAMAAREIASLHAPHSPVTESKSDIVPAQKRAINGAKKQSRRGMLRKGLGVAAATIGAGALLGMESGTSFASTSAHPNDNVGNFSSSNGTTPAVTATGTNGSEGLYASSDSFHGVVGYTVGGGGVVGNSVNGTGGYFFSYTATGLTGRTKTGIAVQATCDDPTMGTALQVIGHIKVQSDSIGATTMPAGGAGTTTVTVTSTAVTAGSTVLLTPVGKTNNKVPWVSNVTAGSFKINVAGTHPAFPISYLIVN